MKFFARLLLACAACGVPAALLAGCAPADNQNANTTATTTVTPPPATPLPQNLTVVERPQKIKDQTAQRGQQDDAAPTLRFLAPTEGATVNGSTVAVRLALGGDLKGYKPHKDPETQMGNHIHVILDNQPYEAYYDLEAPFELRNVTAGRHTLRVFPSRPWHESYKNAGACQLVTFTVKGGGDASKPTTTNDGQVLAPNGNANTGAGNKNAANVNNANAAHANANTSAANANNANAAPPREGKDMPPSEAGAVDPKKPLLTYSRPKGEYKGADADAIMLDFWLSNAKLQGDGGDYRVRYTVDNAAPQYLDKWTPIWLSGWVAGKHTVKLELVDREGNVVDNGGYNATTREITVTK
ncbi:MAG TPA: hypothetical protein VF546_09250 [Pyrinomonadaceae bacterium]|jgi:hypothetical protein